MMTAALDSSKDDWLLYAAAAVWKSVAAVSCDMDTWELLVSNVLEIGCATVSSRE